VSRVDSNWDWREAFSFVKAVDWLESWVSRRLIWSWRDCEWDWELRRLDSRDLISRFRSSICDCRVRFESI
jgi:hypothetical protein